ncbi:MAG: DUF4331 family protein [Bacteroidia bacterium]
MKKSTKRVMKMAFIGTALIAAGITGFRTYRLQASSHREAPLIANDPVADNTDLYVFRSPDDTNSVTILSNYVPAELPQGGPNYFSFGENVRYEVHIKNNPATPGDDITYRFTFTKVNQDPTTFFNIRLGQENLKTTYTAEKSIAGGAFTTIVSNGIVPPANIGPRSITGGAGLNAPDYETLFNAAVTTASTGETIYCGPADDPFFVDLGGIFDLGQTRAGGTGVDAPKDGLKCKNVHVIAIKAPISALQKDNKDVTQATNILDPEFVIGVWASASRPQLRTLNGDGTETHSGNWVQVSRLGMPLTNEAVIPIGMKDFWNSLTPYQDSTYFDDYFCNPELGLYMDDNLFGGAVPAMSALRIQHASPTLLGNVDFGNTHDGLYVLYGNAATTGTALDTAIFGKYLLRQGKPRSADLLPIFYTGVPNLAPYQLATGKTAGNPLTAGKPFINNFLPTFGDMLRLNMAVPVTDRTSPDFSSEGIINAAVLGLTDPRFNTNTNLEFIPNMDGFPNGRRLEDDVTRIELQAVSGAALAAVGLWYDDYVIGNSPLTPKLLGVLGYTTGIEQNDTNFRTSFPYVQLPWSGYDLCTGGYVLTAIDPNGTLNVGAPDLLMTSYPNPTSEVMNIRYRVGGKMRVTIKIFDATGKIVSVPVNNEMKDPGTFEVKWSTGKNAAGVYYATLSNNDQTVQSLKLSVVK